MKFLIIFISAIFISGHVNAGIINGDFKQGFEGWYLSEGDFKSEIIDNSVAVLNESLNSTIPGIIQGDDFTFTFHNPLTIDKDDTFLVFDVFYLSTGNQISNSFGDFLSVTVFDALDYQLDQSFFYQAGVDISPTVQNISVDLHPYLGRDVAISFEMLSEDNGLNTAFFLDNIKLSESVTAVSEPPIQLLFLFILLLILWVSHSLKLDKLNQEQTNA